jgi:hypothetical protein
MRQCLCFFRPLTMMTLILWMMNVSIWGQKPIIEGDTMICPEAVGRLSVPNMYDSYQWYRRYFGSMQEEKLDGATTHQLDMPYFDFAATYIRVEVVVGGERFASDTVFVDGWVFVPATVASVGNYTVNFDGEFVLCEGDSIQFTLSSTYSENITWYKDGIPIEGETSGVYVVRTPGVYYVEGAPELCPDFLQGPGIPLIVVGCTTSTREPVLECKIWAYPNPTTHAVQVKGLPTAAHRHPYTLSDLSGRIHFSGFLSTHEQAIDLKGQVPPGCYLLSFPEQGVVTKVILVD